MTKLIKKCSETITCPKCEWTYIPNLKDWEWHKKNCGYMKRMNDRIRSVRKNELKFWRKYFKKILEK